MIDNTEINKAMTIKLDNELPEMPASLKISAGLPTGASGSRRTKLKPPLKTHCATSRKSTTPC